MRTDLLVQALSGAVGVGLANDLVADFSKMRRDFATKTLERATPGKFVETFVQCAQQMATGVHDKKPDVDKYLNAVIENQSGLPEGIRICAGRMARSIYTLRNKRNVAHKAEIDPNSIDLGYCYHAAAWILSELLRTSTGISMEAAGRLIAEVQVPVDALVEDFDDERIVLHASGVKSELLVLFHSHYPEYVGVSRVIQSLGRSDPKQVRSRIRELYAQKALHGSEARGYVLTQKGYAQANDEIAKLMAH